MSEPQEPIGFVFACYPSDPIEPDEVVYQKMMGYESLWTALYEFAGFMRNHPSPMLPTRIEVMTVGEWKERRTRSRNVVA